MDPSSPTSKFFTCDEHEVKTQCYLQNCISHMIKIKTKHLIKQKVRTQNMTQPEMLAESEYVEYHM